MNTTDKNKTPEPGAPVELIDAARIYTMIERSNKKTEDALQDLSARLATTQRDVINMRDTVAAVSQDFAATRVQRLQQEITDQEKERKILEERIKIVDAKLDEKKTATVGAINTTDRIKQTAEMTYEERERIEKDARAATWKKRWETMTTAVMVSLSVTFVGSVVAAIWWFVVFYLNNR